MISIRAINRQTGWLGVEVPWSGAALLASHSLMGGDLISEGSLICLPSPKHPCAPREHDWRHWSPLTGSSAPHGPPQEAACSGTNSTICLLLTGLLTWP